MVNGNDDNKEDKDGSIKDLDMEEGRVADAFDKKCKAHVKGKLP